MRRNRKGGTKARRAAARARNGQTQISSSHAPPAASPDGAFVPPRSTWRPSPNRSIANTRQNAAPNNVNGSTTLSDDTTSEVDDYIQNSFSHMDLDQQAQFMQFAHRDLTVNDDPFLDFNSCSDSDASSDADTTSYNGDDSTHPFYDTGDTHPVDHNNSSSSEDHIAKFDKGPHSANIDLENAFNHAEAQLLGDRGPHADQDVLPEEDIVFHAQTHAQSPNDDSDQASNPQRNHDSSDESSTQGSDQLTDAVQLFLNKEKNARKTALKHSNKEDTMSRAVDKFRTRPLNSTTNTPLSKSRDWMEQFENELDSTTPPPGSRKQTKQRHAAQLQSEIDFARRQMAPKSRAALARVERKTNPVNAERCSCEKAVRAVLQFAEDGVTEEITFMPLSNRSREVLHKVAAASGLRSKSNGYGKNRKPTVYRLGKPKAVKLEKAMYYIDSVFGASTSSGQSPQHEHRATLARPLDDSNQGHRLLTRMGWSEGDGLGVTKDGRKDPVPVTIRSGRQGLS